MRRLFLVLVLLAFSLTVSPNALAAPQLQDQKPVIAQPETDAVVRGVVQVVGTATHPQFLRYELYYAPWPVPSDNAWIFIGPDAHFQQQPLGLLGTWDSRSVPDGAYALRVRVVRQDSNYFDSDPRRVTVANNAPVETPTPAVTETPTPEPTESVDAPTPPPAGPAPTVVIDIPAAAGTPTQVLTPTATIAPSPTPLLSSGDAGDTDDAGGAATSEFFSSSRLMTTARTAAFYTLAAFVALGLFFGTKALLVWLWHRIRP